MLRDLHYLGVLLWRDSGPCAVPISASQARLGHSSEVSLTLAPTRTTQGTRKETLLTAFSCSDLPHSALSAATSGFCQFSADTDRSAEVFGTGPSVPGEREQDWTFGKPARSLGLVVAEGIHLLGLLPNTLGRTL